MQKKRIIPMALALCLLAGCGTKAKKETETNTVAQATETTTEITTQTTTEEITTATVVEEMTPTDSLHIHKAAEVIDEAENILTINFYRDDLKIYGKLYLPEGEGPFPVVIAASGISTSYTKMEQHAKTFADNGIACVVFDFIGGCSPSNSDGDPTSNSILTEVADIEAIMDELSAFDNIDTNNMFLWGHSLGGLAVSYVAAHNADSINGLIAVEPSYQMHDQIAETFPDISEVPDVITSPMLAGKIFVVDMLSFDIYEEINSYTGNVLLIGGTVAPSMGAEAPEFLERAASIFPSAKIEFVDGATHEFSGDAKKAMLDLSIEFIKEHIN